jgi:hypothetical protein
VSAALIEARRRLADRTVQPYNKAAILNGDWDNGSLVRDELALVEAEQAKKEKKT